MAVTTSLLELVERSSFIFAGTVTSLGPSPVRVLASLSGLAVVHFDRGFLTNPVLGDLEGRPITVQLARETVAASAHASTLKRRFIFFATAWVHGKEIAVTEIGRLDDTPENEQEVARIVASLPQNHLNERIASAVLIVHGRVREIARAADIPGNGTEHDPLWMRAFIEVVETVKGSAPKASQSHVVELLFPGSGDHAFRNVPRPQLNEEAVFLLHAAQGRLLPPSALVAPDRADIQAPANLPVVKRQLIANQ